MKLHHARQSNRAAFINRTSNTIQYPAIVDAMVRAVTSPYSLADVAKP